MEQYIKKSALVAWIENQIDSLERNSGCSGIFGETQMAVYDKLYSFLNTLEVKEVDLEKEIQQHINDCLDIKFPTTDIKMIAKDVEYTARKFFELGLNSQKVKEVDLIIHTNIAECCDWLAMNTNLSHDKIEECRNLMLAGVEKMKEEMMKNVVLETKVMKDNDGDGIDTPYEEWLTLEDTEIPFIPDDIGLKDGDKVKVIIIKK